MSKIITYSAAEVLAPQFTQLFNGLVRLLDLSFANDPMTNWLFRNFDHDEFPKQLTRYHRLFLRASLLSGASIIVVKEKKEDSSNLPVEKPTASIPSSGHTSFKAMTILIPPSGNKRFESALTHLRAGIIPFVWHAGFSPVFRLLGDLVPKTKKMLAEQYPAPNQHHKDDQWHLLVLAARPDCQGQGLGKTLILECQKIVTDEAQKSKSLGEYVCPLHIEASSEGSKRLYNRTGFVDTGSIEYGTVKKGENVSRDENGKVSGAKLYGLVWKP